MPSDGMEEHTILIQVYSDSEYILFNPGNMCGNLDNTLAMMCLVVLRVFKMKVYADAKVYALAK